jgi:putative transposase
MPRDGKQDESVLKALTYPLSMKKATEQKLEWVFARCCELYNAALQERREAYT